MKNFIGLFKDSYKESKNLRCITLVAMFGALSLVINMYLTINIGDFLKIKFTFIPNTFVFYLFGPFVGMVYAAAMDILQYFISPMGPYFFGFTFNALLIGLIYGIILYKKPIHIFRVLIASTIKMLFINLILNSYWISLLYGKAYWGYVSTRFVKQIIMIPIETIVIYLVLKGVKETGILNILRTNYSTSRSNK